MLTSVIGDALFTKTQQRVLSLLYAKPEQSYYLNELVRLAGVGKGVLKRELDKFCAAGLLTLERRGNQTHYQANAENPIFNELKAITLKTFGVVDVLKMALLPALAQVEQAFIYGSVAKESAQITSDVDVMIISQSLGYSDVMALLTSAEQQLGRPINPTLYSPEEFASRQQNNQHFITRVMAQPKLWLVGEMA